MAHNELASVNRELSKYRQYQQFFNELEKDRKLTGAQALVEMRHEIHGIIIQLEDRKRELERELP